MAVTLNRLRMRTKTYDRQAKSYSGAYLFCRHLLEGSQRLSVRRRYYVGQVGRHEPV